MMMKDVIKAIMAAGEVPLLIGEAGIGKTTIIHDIANETGRRVIEIPLQVMDAEDFIGMVKQTPDGKFDFLLPNWFPTDPKEKVIIFLDEINRSTRRVRGALLKIVLERQLNGHSLPKDTWLAAAMNPATDDYEVEETFDQAFLSRFIRIDMKADVDDWLQWARKANVNKNVINFIRENRQWLITKPSEDGNVATNPRTWVKVSNLLNALTQEQIQTHGFDVLKNQIGNECAVAFLNFLKNQTKDIKPDEFLNKPKEILADVQKLPDDKKNVLLTKVVDYVVEKMDKNIDYTQELINALNVLRDAFDREHFAGMFRYIYELTKSDDKGKVAALFEELTMTDIGQDMYEAWTKM